MANTRQQSIAIQSSQVTADLTDYVMLVTRDHLDDEVVDPSGGNAARTDGGDLRFYSDASKTTEYAREIVKFEHDSVTSAGDAVVEVWVKITGTTTSASNKTIYVEYGDGALTDYAATATYGRNNVWTDYDAVYHFGSDTDASGNSNDITSGAGITYGDSQVSMDTVSTTDTLSIPTAFSGVSSFTINVDVEFDDSGRWCLILDNNRDASVGIWRTGTNDFRFKLVTSGGTYDLYDTTPTHLAGRYRLTYVYDGSTAYIYKDGAVYDSLAATGTVVSAVTDANLGSKRGDPTSDQVDGTYYDASILYNTARNSDWVATEYNNLSSPSTFATAGTPTDLTTGTVSDINTDEIVEDGESGVTFTTTGFSGEISTATINDGTNSTSASNVSSTGGAGTFDLPNVSGYTSDTAGSPFTSASHTIQATLGDGTGTASLGVTYSPKVGWAVVEVASAVKTQGSVFENFVGIITDTSQVLYPTASSTSVSSTGILTTDKTTGSLNMQFWDASDATWKSFSVIIGDSPGGDTVVQPVVSSMVLSMVSNTVK